MSVGCFFGLFFVGKELQLYCHEINRPPECRHQPSSVGRDISIYIYIYSIKLCGANIKLKRFEMISDIQASKVIFFVEGMGCSMCLDEFGTPHFFMETPTSWELRKLHLASSQPWVHQGDQRVGL